MLLLLLRLDKLHQHSLCVYYFAACGFSFHAIGRPIGRLTFNLVFRHNFLFFCLLLWFFVLTETPGVKMCALAFGRVDKFNVSLSIIVLVCLSLCFPLCPDLIHKMLVFFLAMRHDGMYICIWCSEINNCQKVC